MPGVRDPPSRFMSTRLVASGEATPIPARCPYPSQNFFGTFRERGYEQSNQRFL
jgi:hypothetical protein